MSRTQQTLSMHRGARVALISVGCVMALICSLMTPTNRVHAQEALSVTVSFTTGTLLSPNTPIEIHPSRALKSDEGRIAVVLGHSDITSLFIADGPRLVYSPSLMSLPLGESELVVYRVAGDSAWSEIARFPIVVAENSSAARVISNSARNTSTANTNSSTEVQTKPDALQNNGGQLAPAGSSDDANGADKKDDAKAENESADKLKFVPSVTVAWKSQLFQFNFPENSRPKERATFNDATVQFSLRSEAHRGAFAAQSQYDFAGSSFQEEALRFSTLANNAPQIDLSSYLMQLQFGRAKVAVGHTSIGTSRHLINSFSSRGITLTVPITKRFDFSLGAMNGTNIVGYGNFFGLGKDKHQLQSATVGVEFLPKRPGGLRLEVSGINAYIQALNSVSQGSVNDVERSKGGSVRLIATDKSGRFKFDGGFTRSQYRNPADPLLYQGTNTVAVPFVTRNARYFDISYDLLRGVSLTKTKQMSLSLAARHEQVDPLFKSLGAAAGADKLQNDFQVNGSIGEITFQAGHSRFNDNLRHVASILQSLTRANQFSLALPAAALWGKKSDTSNFLPRLSYSWSRTHQFGAAIPVRGGFETDPGSIPDQFSTSQNLSADWQFKKFTAGYNYNRSFTNNEQVSGKQFDFLNQTNAARVGFNPASKFNLTFELNRDSANDLQGLKLLRTWRVGSTATWNPQKSMTWTATISNTIAGDRAQTSGSRNTEFDTQFSYRLAVARGDFKKMQTQAFLRYANRYARTRELLLGFANLTRVQIVNAGVSVTFF